MDLNIETIFPTKRLLDQLVYKAPVQLAIPYMPYRSMQMEINSAPPIQLYEHQGWENWELGIPNKLGGFGHWEIGNWEIRLFSQLFSETQIKSYAPPTSGFGLRKSIKALTFNYIFCLRL